jgi:hypothetical protein
LLRRLLGAIHCVSCPSIVHLGVSRWQRVVIIRRWIDPGIHRLPELSGLFGPGELRVRLKTMGSSWPSGRSDHNQGSADGDQWPS